jgi:hypothetical protein
LGVEWLFDTLVTGSPILGQKRGLETYITALSAEEVSNMPFSATGYNNFSFNGRLAALAARTVQLVEIEVAVEAWHAGLVIVDFCC